MGGNMKNLEEKMNQTIAVVSKGHLLSNQLVGTLEFQVLQEP